MEIQTTFKTLLGPNYGNVFVNHPSTHDSAWLQSVVGLSDGYEVKVVEAFTQRLIRLAQSRLPLQLNRRCDAEDIVQSVFQSFFKRNEDQKFEIRNTNDLWRLLAAMTYKKSMQAIEFHTRQRRNIARENDPTQSAHQSAMRNLSDDPSVSALAMMAELLDQILVELPGEHQEIIRLRLMDYSIDEIAAEVAVSTRTVDRALHSARKIANRLVEAQ